MRIRLAVLAFACAAVLPALDVPAPDAMPDDKAFVVAVIPDIRATLGHVEAAAGALGQPMPPGMIAAQLGGALGDPELANLGSGPIVAVVGPSMFIPAWAVIVPASKPEAYVEAAVANGLVAEAVPGNAVISQSVDGLELGKRIAPTLAKLTAKGMDARILVGFDRLSAAYLPLAIQGMTQAMAHPPQGGPAQPKELVALFGAIVKTLATESGSIQVDLNVSAAGMRLDMLSAPRAGGAIAKGLIAPAPAGAKPLAGRFGKAGGYLTMAGRINPKIVLACADVIDLIAKDPAAKTMLSPEVSAYLREWGGIINGELMMTQGIGGQPMAQEGQYGITDQAKAVVVMERFTKLFQTGPVATLYQNMGLAVALQPAVRKGPAGEQIDRITISVDATKMVPEQAEMMQKMLLPSEIGYGTDSVVMSTLPASIDVLLGAGRGPCTLAAEKTLGAGWDGYIDYDFGMQMRAQAKMMEGTPGGALMGEMFGSMPVGHPLAMAWAIRDGKARMTVDLPMSLAVAFKQMAGQQHGRPQIEPEPEPENQPARF